MSDKIKLCPSCGEEFYPHDDDRHCFEYNPWPDKRAGYNIRHDSLIKQLQESNKTLRTESQRLEEEVEEWSAQAAALTFVIADKKALQEENAELRKSLKEALPFIGYQAHVPDLIERVEAVLTAPPQPDKE